MCRPVDVDNESNKGIVEEDIEYFRLSNKGIKPKHLDDWVAMFRDIFGDRIMLASLESIAFHYFEEVGEVISSIRNYAELEKLGKLPTGKLSKKMIIQATIRYKDDARIKSILSKRIKPKAMAKRCEKFLQSCIREEIADVFSWMCASVIKITKMRQGYINHDKRYLNSRLGPGTATSKPAYSIFLDEMVPNKKELSSFVALEYSQGCTACDNFKTEKKVKCGCASELPSRIIG